MQLENNRSSRQAECQPDERTEMPYSRNCENVRTGSLRTTSQWGAIGSLLTLLLALPLAQAQLTYVPTADGITITAYTGTDAVYTVPSIIEGSVVTRIGPDAFSWNQSLTQVTIPDSVISIADGAFSWCPELTSVSIGKGVRDIGASVFRFCQKLSQIDVDSSNPAYSSLDGILFNRYRTTLLVFPGGKTGSYTIPDTVSSIQAHAFGCNPGLTAIELGAGIAQIDPDAFETCDALISVTVNPLNDTYSDVDGVLLNKDQTSLLMFPAGRSGDYVVPEGVLDIADHAFSWATHVTSVSLPDSVTSIGAEAFGWCSGLTNVSLGAGVSSIGEFTFRFCESLTAIDVHPDNPDYASMNGVLLNKDLTRLVQYPEGRSGCYLIPRGVTTVGANAFFDCDGLTSVTIPSSVVMIENYAFYHCGQLNALYFGGNAPATGLDLLKGANASQVYYLAENSGWGSTFAGRPTAVWTHAEPTIVKSSMTFTYNSVSFVASSQGATPWVLIESSPSFSNPTWTAVSTNLMEAGFAPVNLLMSTDQTSSFYRCRVITP